MEYLSIKTELGIFNIPKNFSSIEFKEGEKSFWFGDTPDGIHIYTSFNDFNTLGTRFIPCTLEESIRILNKIDYKLNKQ